MNLSCSKVQQGRNAQIQCLDGIIINVKLHRLRLLHWKVAQRSCGVSILGDIQDPFGHGPVQPTLDPQPFYDSVTGIPL